MEPLLPTLLEISEQIPPGKTQSGEDGQAEAFGSLLSGELNKKTPLPDTSEEESNTYLLSELGTLLIQPEKIEIPDLDGKLSAYSTAIHTKEISPPNLFQQKLPLQEMDGFTEQPAGLVEQNINSVLSTSPIPSTVQTQQVTADSTLSLTESLNKALPDGKNNASITQEVRPSPATVPVNDLNVTVEKWSAVFGQSEQRSSSPDNQVSLELPDLSDNSKNIQKYSQISPGPEKLFDNIQQVKQGIVESREQSGIVQNEQIKNTTQNLEQQSLAFTPGEQVEIPVLAVSSQNKSHPLRLDSNSQYLHSHLPSSSTGFVGSKSSGGSMTSDNGEAFKQTMLNQTQNGLPGTDDSTQDLSTFVLSPSIGSLTAQNSASTDTQLPSSSPLLENRIVDQVINRFSVNHKLETGTISLKLNPQELGELKVHILIEQGNIRAHIVTANPQVQEIFERHIPKLRDSLTEHGFNLENMEVTVATTDDSSFQFSQDSPATTRQQHHQKPVPKITSLDPIEEKQEAHNADSQGLSVLA